MRAQSRTWLRRTALHQVVAVLAAATLVLAAQTEAPRGATPQRVVSLVPAVTEMLFAMGAGTRVVGVSAYDRFPDEVRALPTVGGLLDPNVERVLSLRPDLVIVYGSQTALQEQLRRATIDTFVYTHKGLADVTTTLRALGERIGAATAAERVASDMERGLGSIRTRVAGRRRPRTLLVIGRERGSLRQIRVSGGYGFLHDLLELAGGQDVLRDVRRESVEMGIEMVLGLAPEVVVELHYGRSLTSAELAVERRVWDVVPALPAVRNRRVHLLMGDEFVVAGPRIVVAAEALSGAIHAPVGADLGNQRK